MLTLTDRAVAVLKTVCTPDTPAVRIMALSGGCAGVQYRMGLEAAASADDAVIECSGLQVLVDQSSTLWLTGVTVDFVESEQGAGFVFDNPSPKAKCSCSGSCG
ncbi:MAG: iron-sulfur cluster assembly accessory protein [Magnetospirillum sp.]|nr:iron-sulfur cluster assembly accessory protein [Magnetospirillum sp.]